MPNEEIFAATAIKTWTTVNSRVEKMLSSLSDEELQIQIAPGRNRVYYILGHLAAHHDLLLPLLGIGERLHPELDEFFIKNPDRTFPDKFTAAELRRMFTEVNATVTSGMGTMPPADLLKRHGLVSEEDFAKEPIRNRLALFEIRAAHAMYHAGQIRLVEIVRERYGNVPFERKGKTEGKAS
jgi:hypothetical protein